MAHDPTRPGTSSLRTRLRHRLVRGITIRRQLAALAILVALPLVGVLAYVDHVDRQHDGDAASSATVQLANLMAGSVQQFVARLRGEMEVIAARPSVRRVDGAHCDPILAEETKLNPFLANIVILDPSGFSVCSVVPAPPKSRDLSGAAWFVQARRSGRFTVGEPFLGPITHRTVAVLVLPMKDQGRTIGYVAAPIDLLHFQAFFAGLASPSQSLLAVISESGQIVARSEQAQRFVGTYAPRSTVSQLQLPTVTTVGIDGVRRLYAHTRIRDTRWIATAGIPTAVAYGPTDRLRRTLTIVFVGVLAFMTASAMLLGRWIARPIELLARRARDIARGHQPGATLVNTPREAAIAAERFEEMVAAVRDGEQRLTRALDDAGMGVWELDPASGETWRSPQHDRIFGYAEPVPEWSVETAMAHVVSEDRALFQTELARAFEGKRVGFEFRIAWDDGSIHWVRVEASSQQDQANGLDRVVGTIADVTARVTAAGERAELEDQLRQSQKMDAVGQLCGGIAHDFNNLLTVICGYSNLALTHLDGTSVEAAENVKEVARAGERATELTSQLLSFSRRQQLQQTAFDLNDAVSASVTLFRRLLGAQIEIDVALAPGICPVYADLAQIEQVLMNLALNARDAMPDGGVLTIRTETVGPDTVRLRMADTGHGMDAETREHAFEPFFTTKPVGQGTGLGLATVFGTVQQNGGSIALSSEEGKGTAFEILLPRAPDSEVSSAGTVGGSENSGNERVLLVEDDASVRELTRAMLSGKGYDVLVATDGEEALRLAHAESFDILVSDIVMPKLGGAELAKRVRLIHPNLPVIFMSGYSFESGGVQALAPATAFIQKPFSVDALCDAIRATLDAAGEPLAA